MSAMSSAFCEFAASARFEQFPNLAQTKAFDAMLDCVGCMLLGAEEPLAAILAASIVKFDKPSVQTPAQLVGARAFSTPGEAALFNGALAHAIDFDDTNHPGYAHPSAVLLPAIMAASNAPETTIGDAICAYIVGFELIGKLGRCINTAHYERGWHPTKTLGCMAGALAAGRMLRLNSEQLARALSIAAASAGGMRGNFGTMVKPLHAGQAAQIGVSSAVWAKLGMSAQVDIFERKYGYFDLMRGEDTPQSDWMQRPGDPLEILEPEGLALKPFPCCGATHPAIEAAQIVRAQLAGERIAEVTVGASRLSFAPLIHKNPKTPLEAKFSMEFCVAAALLRNAIEPSTFVPHEVNAADIQALIPQIKVIVDERVADSGEFAAIVSVNAENGQVFTARVDLARGKPARSFSPSEQRTKFVSCAKLRMDERAAGVLFDTLSELKQQMPLSHLTDLLASI